MDPIPHLDEMLARVGRHDRLACEEVRVMLATNARSDVLDRLAGDAAGGSEEALALLLDAVDEHRLADPAIRRLVFDHAAVEDVRQDTLIAVARSIRVFRGEARFTTWLYRVATNSAIAHLRRRRVEEPLGDASGDWERMSSMVATRATLQAAIDRLDEPYRSAVVFRDIEQLPYREIADRLGKNLNTVKSHVARGRARVVAYLGRP